jgi:hypothetical protein
MGHSYNNGIHTTSKGITYDAVRIKGLNSGGTPAIEEDCKSGLISSVSQAVAGTVVLQLSTPYPPKLVICIPKMSQANGTTDIVHAEYKRDGYDATAGTLTIFLENDDDSGAPVLVQPASAEDELHVLLAFNRYTN